MHLSNLDKQELREAIRNQEIHTTGEIVTVITRASDNYYFIPTLWAALLALLTPYFLHLANYSFHFLNDLPFIYLSKHLHVGVYQMQIIVFCLFALLFRWPWLKLKLIPKSIQYQRASRLAHEQFHQRGLHTKDERTGILLFVSVAERYVEILADKNINQAVESNTWKRLVDSFVAHVKRGDIKQGYLVTIEEAGKLLHQYSPCIPERDKNELPDHLIDIT